MESGGGIGQIERDKKPLFRGECSGVINLVLREPIANFARAPETTEAGNRGIPFHKSILQGNTRAVMTGPWKCHGSAAICSLDNGRSE